MEPTKLTPKENSVLMYLEEKYDYFKQPGGNEATTAAAARTFIKEAIEMLKDDYEYAEQDPRFEQYEEKLS